MVSSLVQIIESSCHINKVDVIYCPSHQLSFSKNSFSSSEKIILRNFNFDIGFQTVLEVQRFLQLRVSTI